MRDAGEHRDAAPDVVTLLAPRERASAHDVVELCRVELRDAIEKRAHDSGREVVRPDLREGALDRTPDGRAHDVDDDRRGPG